MKTCLNYVLITSSFLYNSFLFSDYSKKKYLITDYGAKSDSTVLNTTSIQKTIDECASNGGGVVIVPKGIFISGAIFLKKDVSLNIEKEGVLKGSSNQADYPQINTRWEGEERLWTSAFVNAIGVDDIELNGEGTIDGSGDVWVKDAPQRRRQSLADSVNKRVTKSPSPASSTTARSGRPRLICFDNCKNIKISGLHFHNQAVWCLHILYCKKVVIENLNITADHTIPSSDGIDIDSCDGVTVTGCFIDVNDDCISIKSGKDEDGLRVNRPSENILIEKCHFAYGHGGVAMGSETSGGIKHVEVRDCLIDGGNWAPIRFKTQPSRSGIVEDITYRNIILKDTHKAFEFNMEWRMVGIVKAPAKILPVVRNIKLINISGNVNVAGDITGLKASPIQCISFKNCNIIAEKGLVIQYATGTDISGLKLRVKSGEPVIYK
jgi:polygalacturonase